MHDIDLIRGARLWSRHPGEPFVDVKIVDGRIGGISPTAGQAAPPASGVVCLEAGGRVLLPSLAAVHEHFDSSGLGAAFRPHTAGDSLEELIADSRGAWRESSVPLVDRVRIAAERTIASGATAIRSHVQIDTECRLERFEAMAMVREELAGVASFEIVAFPQCGYLQDPGSERLVDEALAAGADLVGGIDPCGLERDARAHLDIVFGLAQKHDVGVDLHLHERGPLGEFTLELVCDRVTALGMQGLVTISHAFALATLEPRPLQRLLGRLAEADIAVTTIAPMETAPLPHALLRDTGIRCGLGQDGMRDGWSPWGDGDLLRRTRQLALRSAWSHDEDIELAVDIATRGGRAVLDAGRRPRVGMTEDEVSGLAVGAPADLLLVEGTTVTEALMDCAPQRTVVRRGVVVADGGRVLL